MPNPINPNSPSPHSPTPPTTPSTPSNQWNPPPLTWLGMKFNQDETKKLWTTIMQTVLSQIQHESDRMKKAMKKLRKSEEGKDD